MVLQPALNLLQKLKERWDDTLTHAREKTLGKYFLHIASYCVFALIAGSTEIFIHYREQEQRTEQSTAALSPASELRARTDRELNSVLYLSSGIVGYLVVRHNYIDENELRNIFEAIHAYSKHVRNFTLAIDYKVVIAHPLKGNEAIVGKDYRDIPAQWPIVSKTISSHQNTLTGPVNLVQGGQGLIYRIPIYIDGKYWGLLSTVIDINSLRAAILDGLNANNFDFAIRNAPPNFPAGKTFIGNDNLQLHPQAKMLVADMPNAQWTYIVKTKPLDNPSALWVFRIAGWLFAVVTALGIATLLKQRQELAIHAGFDNLTKLPNRRLFDDRLDQAMRRQSRKEDTQLTLLFLDLNGFKDINDKYGHRFGDIVLHAVANRIRNETRYSDTVARWAGDEFAIIIEDTCSRDIEALVARLRTAIAQPIHADGKIFTVTTAIGNAIYPSDAQTTTALIELADHRMFADKAQCKR